MRRTRGPLKMRSKILLSCVLCMVLALGLQTVLFYQSSSRIIYGQAQQISLTTMENLQEDLYKFNKAVENSLIKIYNHAEFMRDFSAGKQADALGQYSQVTYDLAHDAFTPSQNLTSLYLYTPDRYAPDHGLVSSYRHAQTPIYAYPEDIYDATQHANTDMVDAYLASDERVMLMTGHYNQNRDVTLVRYVLKIYRNSTDYIGYIVCDVDPKPFLNMLEKHRYTQEQIIWIQPEGDHVILQLGEVDEAQTELYNSITAKIHERNTASGFDAQDDAYELFTVQERKYNFKAFSLMPQSVLLLNQTMLLQNTIFVVAVILGLFSVLFLLISHSLTTPLTYVVNTMQRIKQGNRDLRLKKMKQDEIGILGSEFNDMLDEIERLIAQEYESKLLMNDAKYKALQAQVNPHFLYNTLDTMSGIASAQGCNTVSNLCKALSNIFRYSLEMRDPYSSLENEIIHIKNYMYIMNVRTNHSVELSIVIDSDLLAIRTPRLSLQPLVENAIQHGLKNKRGDKIITVGAGVRGENLLLWVEDNGVGMDAEQMNAQLQKSVSQALQKNESIGVDNINARVKLLFGNEYGIGVTSEIGKGSRVTLCIPSCTKEEAEHE